MHLNQLINRKTNFQDLVLTLPVALIFSHLIIYLGQEYNFFEIIGKKGYVTNLMLRSCFSISVCMLVREISIKLDASFPFKHNKYKRPLYQLYFGVVTMLVLDFFSTSLYLYFMDIDNIFVSIYFDKSLYSMIILYILLVNVYYNFGFFIPQIEITPGSEENGPDNIPELQPHKIIELCQTRQLVLIYIDRKRYFSKNRQGEIEVWDVTLIKTMEALPADQFYFIGRSHIVHRSIIIGISEDLETNTFRVILAESFNDVINIPASHLSSFKLWYGQK